MKVSLEWLSEYLDLSALGTTTLARAQRVAEILTSRGIEVEEIHAQAAGWEHVMSAKILERNRHPQADRLSLCRVTDGQNEFQIVCGAQNMQAGDTVVLSRPGADLPNGMKIVESKIRGELSQGMLCSEAELGLKEESEGILLLPSGTPLGRPLAEILGRSDVILTLKLTANRADCLSHQGIARELGAALGQSPHLPELKSSIQWSEGIKDASGFCRQFLSVPIQGIEAKRLGKTPSSVVKRLESLGLRSIDPVVDATQWVMLEMGHPTHAYDAAHVPDGLLSVREAREGETCALLDGSTVELQGGELLVAGGRSGQVILGLAGVMGGAGSQVTETTRDLILEVAEFAPAKVRRASSRHAKKTDAAYRFERGIDPLQLERVMQRLVDLVTTWVGGTAGVGSRSGDPSTIAAETRREISFPKNMVSQFLGMSLNEGQITDPLRALGCEVRELPDAWMVIPPSYRLDLHLPQDLCEEVARSVGYDAIPESLPTMTSDPHFAGSASESLRLMNRAKDYCASAGLSEALCMAFSSRAWLSQFGLENGARLLNPISEEFEVLVPALLPGLVQGALNNYRHTFGSESPSVRLFELRPTFQVDGASETGFAERWRLSWAISGARFAQGLKADRGQVDFADARGWLEGLVETLGLRGVRTIPISQSRTQSTERSWFHPHQSVEILAGSKSAGFMGLLHPGLAKKLKIKVPLWICELDWSALAGLAKGALGPKTFKPWPSVPPMERDFALVVKSDVPADKVVQIALKSGRPLAKSARVFDVYRGAPIAEGMTSVAVRVIFYEEGRSLQESETEAVCTQIIAAWQKELGASLRS